MYLCVTFISAVVEHIEGFDRFLSSLLVAKDQVYPLVEVTGHMLALLDTETQTGNV